MNRGGFISVEGIEGVGKSSNIEVLVKHIESAGYEVLTTREPGGTPLAEDIRNHIGHLPVVAGPPSPVYRVRKFVQ